MAETRRDFEQNALNDDGLYTDDVVDSFGTSRLPPRIICRLPGARTDFEKEINDLLVSHGQDPPTMVVVDSEDGKFRKIPRIQSAIVVKRKSVGLYTGRLCGRGDSIPPTHTSFSPSPTALRCAVKLICMFLPRSDSIFMRLTYLRLFFRATH